MPDLLLELFSEEIPARMQAKASEDLKSLITNGLVTAGLTYEGASAYATPRRLALTVQGLSARSPDIREEKKGPRTDAPAGAIQGFLRGAGLSDISEARVVADAKKGDFYVADIVKPGRAAEAIIAPLVEEVIRSFPWPVTMRWGSAPLRWIRPLHSILCTFGSETEEPEVIEIRVDGVSCGNTTRGHRTLSSGDIKVRRFDDYVTSLEKAKVVLDPARRRDIILHDARNLAFASGLELVEDEGLLYEVGGLVEWPVVLMGSFDPAFLEVPDEVIRATIRANQKCFVLRDPTTGRLANKFILTANTIPRDGGATIIAGNERVIRARLSDAKFFWESDQQPLPDYRDSGLKPLDQRLKKLQETNVTFHEKLGTQGERVNRIIALAREIAPLVGADPDKAARAAALAKADLMTGMVGEFPELQGFMGRRYAENQGEDADVSTAIEEHYKPQGPGDRVPTNPVSIAVALADKLDILTGFWAIDEKPTGSKDPFALRRAALGVIRIVLENEIYFSLRDTLVKVSREWLRQYFGRRLLYELHPTFDPLKQLPFEFENNFFIPSGSQIETKERFEEFEFEDNYYVLSGFNEQDLKVFCARDYEVDYSDANPVCLRPLKKVRDELFLFLADRLKVQLRDQGARHDLVDAVFALGGQDDLLLVVKRVEALGALLASDDGKTLLAGYRRAANILKAEEKKGTSVAASIDPARFVLSEERALHAAVSTAGEAAAKAVAVEDFAGAMRALSTLRVPVDAFFEAVLVNDPDPDIRANRLALLQAIRTACHQVADFSRIEG